MHTKWIAVPCLSLLLATPHHVDAAASAQQTTDRVTLPSNSDITKPAPAVEFQVQGGVQGSTSGLNDATHPGPNAQLRIAYDIYQWVSVGANYSVAGQDVRNTVAGDGQLISQAAFGDVRLTAPMGLLRPFAFAGLGIGWTRVHSNSPTPLTNDQSLLLPLGVGLNFMVTKDFALGPQASYVRNLNPPTNPLSNGHAWNAGLAGTYQMHL